MSNNTAEQIEDFDELDALINDAQMDAEPAKDVKADEAEPVVVEEVESEDVDHALLEDINDDLEEADSVEAVEDAPITVTPKPAKKKKASAPRFSTGASLVEFGSKMFDKDKPLLLTVDDAAADDTEQVSNDNLAAFNTVSAVKVREKLANLMMWISGQKSLSKYTMATFQALIKQGEMSKADVRNNLLDLGLSVGTASSQAGQMTHLLKVTKIATVESGKFKFNEDSVIAAMLTPEETTEDNSASAE